jgi:hypothetical protein
MALAPSIANILVDGIASWKIRNATDSDVAYYALPTPRKSNLKISSFTTMDKTLQLISTSYLLEASMEFMGVRTSANFIKLLPLLSTKLIEHKITLIDGSRVISSAPSTSTPSPTGFGAIKWSVVSDKDMDDAMIISIAIKRKLTKLEYNQILTSANTPADGSPTAEDTLYGLYSVTEADIVPAGIAKVELGVAGAGTYADDIDNFRKGVFKMELMPSEDGRGMYRNGAIQIDLDVESLETTEAELLKWDDIQFRKNECRVTLVNGLVFTFPNVANDGLGVKTELTVSKDMDDATFLKVTGGGRILVSQMAALIGA